MLTKLRTQSVDGTGCVTSPHSYLYSK